MKNISKMYRSEYVGEEIVTTLVHTGQEWVPSKEWIPNAVINNQLSRQAVIIGNGISRTGFPLNRVMNHFGGLLGAKRVQTYGCNALYREYTPDFLVATGFKDKMVKEIAESGYCDAQIVYADAEHIQAYPEKFYLVPQDPGYNSGAIATYLACFDSHKKVYLLGFDGQDTDGVNYNVYAGTAHYGAERSNQSPMFWDKAMLKIFDAYDDVDFVRVMPTRQSVMPESWKYVTNLRQIDFRDFVIELDL